MLILRHRHRRSRGPLGSRTLLVGRGRANWPLLFVVGLAGSLVGGLLGSLFSGDGLELRPGSSARS